jgi:hypothetical protein
MSVNRIDATLTDDQRDQANAVRAALPFLIAKDRADRPKFGDKNRPIVVKPPASPRGIPTCCRAVSTSRFRTDAQRAETLYRALCAPVPAGGVMNKARCDPSRTWNDGCPTWIDPCPGKKPNRGTSPVSAGFGRRWRMNRAGGRDG